VLGFVIVLATDDSGTLPLVPDERARLKDELLIALVPSDDRAPASGPVHARRPRGHAARRSNVRRASMGALSPAANTPTAVAPEERKAFPWSGLLLEHDGSGDDSGGARGRQGHVQEGVLFDAVAVVDRRETRHGERALLGRP
jgi:hypothetical protein